MAICKLCNEERELIKKSHIFSNFLYRDLFDENHTLRKFDLIARANGTGKIQKPQSGDWEGQLLCSTCDNEVIGQYESYTADLLNDPLLLDCEDEEGNDKIVFTKVSGLDYKMLKLFVLTLVFRAAIASRAMFKGATLKPEIIEQLRKMIFDGSPGGDLEFPITIWSWKKAQDFPTDIIAQPNLVELKDGEEVLVLIIAGYVVFVYLNPKAQFEDFKNLRLRETGELVLLNLPAGREREMMMSFFPKS